MSAKKRDRSPPRSSRGSSKGSSKQGGKPPVKGGSKGPSAHEDPNREREKARYESPIASRDFILSTLRDVKAPMDIEALGKRLNIIDDDGREALRRRVGAMLRDGQLIQNRKRGLVPVDSEALLTGRVTAHKDGFGFLVPEEGGDDIYLSPRQMRQVLHGDRIVGSVIGTDRRGRREGRIVEVVERANQSLVGRLVIEHGVSFVSPDNKRIHQDLMLPPDALGGGKAGDIVVAEIVEQPTVRQPPVGRVVEVLGAHLQPGMEIDIALRSHGIPTDWPDAVQDEAAGLSTDVEERAKEGRHDVRDLPLITIDGADARDFDDAVWCERTDKGWRLLVAIADVAHYVRPGSALDDEAQNRGTSVYFPGRVVPMLPEVLSNGLCSLNPDVDRLCMLCELTLDKRGALRRARFHNAVMRSHARLTYDQVNEILTDKTSSLRQKHSALVPMIEELHALYKALATSRARRGAIEFDSRETRIVFDDNRKIQELVPVTRNDAHKLIEECMILANVSAAALLEKHEVPALYRVHAGPKADRLEDLRSFLALQNLSLGGGVTPTALDYAALGAQIEDRPDRHVIQTVMLRSMQQAVYQPVNEGHFGLALDQYAHFTSPIRRYPDLLVHRGIKHVLTRQPNADYRYSMSRMQGFGESCSITERRAEEASREVVSWLKCEYMVDQIGKEFAGVISAVTSFGLFIELDGVHVEGLIHITNLAHDYYRFDAASQCLVGERTGKRYRLGDAMRVSVQSVNLDDRKIDFGEVAHKPASGKASRVRTGKARKKEDKQSRRKRKHEDRTTLARAERQLNESTKPSKSADVAAAVVDDTAAVTPSSAKTGESAAEKMVAKKATAKKAASKKTASKKTTAKKAASKKTASKKTASKKTASKKTASKKTASKKTASKKATSKKATSKKATSKKAASKKAASKKATSKKATSKKTTSKKATSKKTAAKKTSSKKRTRRSRSGREQ